MNENQWKLNEISGKNSEKSAKIEPILTQNQLKISYFLDKIHRKSIKFLYYPLIEIERKSAQIDNKFIENQWKSSSKLIENQLFLPENWL